MADACVFCEIIAGRETVSMVREWEDAVAFRPLNPVVPGHILVVPKEHSKDAGTNPQLAGIAMTRAAELASLLPDANIVTNQGRAASQTVWHTHLHILPRQMGDGLPLPWTRDAMEPRTQVRGIYAFEEADETLPSIFLAGPTPRSESVASWRPDALRLIQKAQSVKPDTVPEVLIPEQRYGWQDITPEDQYDWEHAAVDSATVLLFWIPRVMETMPGLTTNIEWGRYIESGRVVVGWPNDAERNRYLEHDAARLGLTVHHDLPSLVTAAFKMMNELQ